MDDNGDNWANEDGGFTELRQHWQKSAEEEQPMREAAAHPNMAQICELTRAMQRDGWQDVQYCPKDGTLVWAWDPLTPVPYHCCYQGEWPKGSWWACTAGDMWPCRPTMFKPLEDGE